MVGLIIILFAAFISAAFEFVRKTAK